MAGTFDFSAQPAGSETFIFTANGSNVKPHPDTDEQLHISSSLLPVCDRSLDPARRAADGLYSSALACYFDLQAHLCAQQTASTTAREHGRRRHPRAWALAQDAGIAIAAAAPGKEMDMLYFFRHMSDTLDRGLVTCQQREEQRNNRRTWWQRRARDPTAVLLALCACDEFGDLRRIMVGIAVLLMALLAIVPLCIAVKSSSSSHPAALMPVCQLQCQQPSDLELSERIINVLPLAHESSSMVQVWQEHLLRRSARAYAISLWRQAH